MTPERPKLTLKLNNKALPPKKLQIGPYNWKVEFVDKPIKRGGNEQDEELAGCCRFDEQVIYIANDQGPDGVADTYLHEILHVVWACVGGWAWEGVDEERIVSMLSTVLLDTMRRNPALISYLMEDDDDSD